LFSSSALETCVHLGTKNDHKITIAIREFCRGAERLEVIIL
jgi:hypothetical protein